MGCPEIRNYGCKSCCEETYDLLKEALFSKRVFENGYETAPLSFMEEFVKLINFKDNSENELRISGNFTAEVDNTDVINAIETQTTNIITNNESNNAKIIDAINNKQIFIEQKKVAIKSTMIDSFDDIQEKTHTLQATTKQVVVRVDAGSGTIGFLNGVTFGFGGDTEKVGTIYDSANYVPEITLKIMLDAGSAITVQELYEVM